LRSILPALLLLLPALYAADEETPAKKKKMSALSLLPDGSELQGITLPRYDENHRLVGVLKAKAMTLVNDQTIAGETIAIEFYNPDRSLRGRMDLTKAMFNQSKRTLEAMEPITIQSDQINVKGAGLVYDFEQGEGFLLGPATTSIRKKTSPTAMKSSHSPLRTGAIIGAALISQPLAATAQPAVSQTETATKAPEHAAASQAARQNLVRDLEASSAANAAAKAFLERTNLSTADPAQPVPEPPQAKPLDLKPGPDDTLISCDGGMYFDPDEGVFVYMKNVRVTDPGFTMTGANELKIFLEKIPAEEIEKRKQERAAKKKAAGSDEKTDPPKKEKEEEAGFRDKFGEVEKIIATGAIVIDAKPKQGEPPIKASGAIFSYNILNDVVLVSGGYPWFVREGIALRAMEPELTLEIHPKTGKFNTSGHWDTFANFEKLRAEQDQKKKDKKKDTNN
jgi:hypothetical protein